MKQFRQKRIAITGGASGLGKALALRAADAGWKVAIVDINDQRGAETLEELQAKGTECFYQRCDVTKIESVEALRDELVKRWGGLDIMVNNAGVATHGAIDAAQMSDWEWVVNINLLGVVRGCKVFSGLFKEQGYGHLVNVASMAGLLYSPEMSSYNATKAGVVALSETMRAELEPFNIGVTLVCPGFFQTNLAESARSPEPGAQQMINKLLSMSTIDADDIADMIFNAVEKKKFWLLPHSSYRYMWYMKRYLPGFYHKGMVTMARKLAAKRNNLKSAMQTS